MQTFAERLIDSYPKDLASTVLPTSRQQALAYLERIANTLRGLDDFTHFPEGPMGVVIFSLMKQESQICPDVGCYEAIPEK